MLSSIHYTLNCLLAVILIGFVQIQPINAQSIWLESKILDGSASTMINHMTSDSGILESAHGALINYNPTVDLSSSSVSLQLSENELQQCHIFTVFQPDAYNTEGLIWSIKDENHESLSLTNQRIVDFHQGKFMNFLDQNHTAAQINSYQHYKSDFKGNSLSIGGLFSNNAIPVRTFEGQLAELIVFNNVLAPSSRARLESALAIKYSISLDANQNYLDALGRVIWDVEKEETYSNRVAGIGKSDVFHLNQKQSKSQLIHGTFSIGKGGIYPSNPENPSFINDQSYLLWGDNGASLEFEKSIETPDKIQRKWKMINSNMSCEDSFAITIEDVQFSNELADDEYLWMALSTDEGFAFGSTQYHKLDPNKNNTIHGASFALSPSTSNYFTFLKAKDLWAELNIRHSMCSANVAGAITCSPQGDHYPMELQLYSVNDAIRETKIIHQTENVSFSDLDQGEYRLQIRDSRHQIWEKRIFINSDDIPTPNVKQSYTIFNDKTILDPNFNEDNGASITWVLPDGTIAHQSTLRLVQEGEHELIIAKNDCFSTFPFEVYSEVSNINELNIGPNPTLNGHFKLSASLHQSSTYSITISTLSGQQISHREYPIQKYINQTLFVPDSGMYLITLQSGNSTATKKLISTISK